MLVLGIETSCDETSAALVDNGGILSNIIATQTIHQDFGGVVPEYASRAHIRQLLPIIREALYVANRSLGDIDGIAVTQGPGLAGSLLIGLCVAKGLALTLDIPLIGINHIEGHILAVAAAQPDQTFPFLCLVASGGHTILVHCEEPFDYKVVGRTLDDAAGEAFDKVAQVLEIGYPGGPAIQKTATDGNPQAIAFPKALLVKDNLDFSFSGLKTAVLYHVQSASANKIPVSVPDVAASFQQAVIEVLIEKSVRALEQYACHRFILAGGVARNAPLRQQFEAVCLRRGIDFQVPSPELCTDNAAMIARAGYFRLHSGQQSPLDLDVIPNLSLD